MGILKFLKSKWFFINIAISIVFIGIIIWVVMINLNLYTRHNQYIKVPDFKGISTSNCEKIANKKNIRIKVIDSLYIKNHKPGTIIEQHPKAGHNVKENREIRLTVCSFKPESIPFPNLKNSPFRQTVNTLKGLGFKIGEIIYTESNYKNLVIDLKFKNDTLTPGTLIEKGSVIDLILGKGGYNRTLVPLVLSKNLKSAKNNIIYSYLNIGEIHFDESIKTQEDQKHATIWKQSPEYQKNLRIDAGRKINIWLTIDKEKTATTDSIVNRYSKR